MDNFDPVENSAKNGLDQEVRVVRVNTVRSWPIRSTHGSMQLAQRFRDFALREARGNSPRYQQRALDIAEDPAALAVIAELPTGKKQPNLVLTAARVHGASADSYPEFRHH
ncbi:DUF2332 family protein [Nocardia mangyaensis]|uniref:DUF2332 family protein n=1 Tax=Nocardia mangyaensis TaxID=2213200 RepID=UPI0026757343|nr:DUF2332 family protein [Nocardia mangyaensis]MDO3649612.1 DUF2332 family protein [Nocardia mangyaensis]